MIFTSYYELIQNRTKQPDDIYIQVSRDLGSYESFLGPLIDFNWGKELGNWYLSLEEYRNSVPDKTIQNFYIFIKQYSTKNIFILCFENLNETYTKEDELMWPGQVTCGEYKKCHRTIIADLLRDKFNLEIEEYKE